MQALNAPVVRRWMALVVEELTREREIIDHINVYPVADGDTGTNLLHTARSAVQELESSAVRTAEEACSALARGALAGARGNSGMLLSQVMRGFAEGLRESAEADVRDALRRARELATEAVAEPAEGTMVSVLAAASQAAGHRAEVDQAGAGEAGVSQAGVSQAGVSRAGVSRAGGSRAGSELTEERLDVVLHRVVSAAVDALDKTTAQLPALGDAGVVDAGGRGVVLVLDALHAVVSGGPRLAPEPPALGTSSGEHHESRYEYEVMYHLTGAGDSAVVGLRETLSELGDCVSVLSDGAPTAHSPTWAVHVHCDDIGSAIEAGIETGRVRGIRVVRFADQVSRRGGDAVLTCVRGQALAELFRAEGARVVPIGADRPLSVDDLLDAVVATDAAHVTVLPNDESLTPLAEEAARRSLDRDRDVVVVPTSSSVQGLAALAVRDPGRRRAEDTVAMAEAAAATRRGELRIAEQEALTWAGRCQPGEVLGLVDGEVVLLGADPVSSARELVDRMLSAGGELITLVVGDNAPESLTPEVTEHLRRTHPEVELSSYAGGDLGALLLVGME